MTPAVRIAISIASSILTVAASYGMAVAGEPTSRWLWGNVLGLM